MKFESLSNKELRLFWREYEQGINTGAVSLGDFFDYMKAVYEALVPVIDNPESELEWESEVVKRFINNAAGYFIERTDFSWLPDSIIDRLLKSAAGNIIDLILSLGARGKDLVEAGHDMKDKVDELAKNLKKVEAELKSKSKDLTTAKRQLTIAKKKIDSLESSLGKVEDIKPVPEKEVDGLKDENKPDVELVEEPKSKSK